MTELNMPNQIARALIAGLLAACATACGSAGPPSSDAVGPSAEEFPNRVATLFCGVLQDCCATAQLPYDAAKCQSQISGEFQRDVTQVGNGLAFDRAAAQRCLDELTLAMQGCSWSDKLTTQDCDRLLVGTLAVGSPCTDGRACAGPPDVPTDCMFDASGTNGICALKPATPRGRAGEACSTSCDTKGQCSDATSASTVNIGCYQSDGLYCSPALVCTPISGAGGPCS
ncbi:MAG TPA: hypothetical protein VNW92_14100, partial [Polyangiaceae bacterium]|nr:hypothetical protein [Polyangiaceae bacterium]